MVIGGEGEVINWRINVLEEQLRDRRVHLPLHLVTRHHRDGRGGERLRPRGRVHLPQQRPGEVHAALRGPSEQRHRLRHEQRVQRGAEQRDEEDQQPGPRQADHHPAGRGPGQGDHEQEHRGCAGARREDGHSDRGHR